MSKKPVSCGLIVSMPSGWLLCHPTGNAKWDLPKGRMEETDETPLHAAFREAYEEIGIDLMDHMHTVRDLGCHPYNREKNLHLFQLDLEYDLDVSSMRCLSLVHIHDRSFPEMDDYVIVDRQTAYEKLSKSMQKWLTSYYKM